MVTKTITLEELPSLLQQVPASLRQSTDNTLMLPRVVETARAFCPAKTGALRESIRIERPSALSAVLVAGGGTVDYARLVHDGTVNTPAMPFLEQAIMSEKTRIGNEVLRGALP